MSYLEHGLCKLKFSYALNKRYTSIYSIFAPRVALNKDKMSISTEERIKILTTFCKEEPDNPFNLYSLFLETQKVSVKKAIELGNQLIQDFPNYLPTFYMFGNLLEEDYPEKALEIYKQGIKIAQQEENIKTENELKSALQNLEFELD